MVNESSIDKLDKRENKVFNELIKKIQKSEKMGKSIILFGAGIMGMQYLKVIREISKVQIIFCDNNIWKYKNTINGIDVISFDELKNKYRDNDIVITSILYYDEILSQLKECNLQMNVFKRFDISLISYGFKDYYTLVSDNHHKFKDVYNLLTDEYSKKIFVDRINYCITGDDNYLVHFNDKTPQYFAKEIIKLSNDEIFADCGAYIGDTLEEFLNQTEGDFKKIYCFEPEKEKREIISNKFDSINEIEVLPFGVWSKNDKLRFNSEQSVASSINESGNTDIFVVSIDEVLDGEPVTFIKMDIEGSELEALKGAKKTIQKYLPKLAICIYHKPLDIVEIPIYIKQIAPDYNFYLRHYSDWSSESVLYAIADK